MGIYILSADYQLIFVDDPKYEERVAHHLCGLAAVIEACNDSWRPTVSQLLELLPQSDSTNAIVSAGMAYGAGYSIEKEFPGPAILLYGAALNVIGSAPNTDLAISISKAKRKLEESPLANDQDLKVLIRAATERASFDKVSQMLRDEFTNGLTDSGLYRREFIDDIVPKIVKVTHDVRHKGLIERLFWKRKTVGYGGSSTDVGFMHLIKEVEFIDDELRNVLPYAQQGCAFSIFQRLNDRRISSG